MIFLFFTGKIPISIGVTTGRTPSESTRSKAMMKSELRKQKKEREELSKERIRELSQEKKTLPFDELRNRFRNPNKKPVFTEIDSSDPDFDFERFPVKPQGN